MKTFGVEISKSNLHCELRPNRLAKRNDTALNAELLWPLFLLYF